VARTTPVPPAPAGVRYVGPYGEQTAFVLDDRGLGRPRRFPPGVPVRLAASEVEQMLTHPEYEPVTESEMTAFEAPTPEAETGDDPVAVDTPPSDTPASGSAGTDTTES
jgi:hypothetical protein